MSLVKISASGSRLTLNVYAPDRTPDSPLEWQDEALCAQTDPEIFNPPKGASPREAKKVCARCDVKAQCLAYALENNERFGVWGGLTNRQRLNLQKARAA